MSENVCELQVPHQNEADGCACEGAAPERPPMLAAGFTPCADTSVEVPFTRREWAVVGIAFAQAVLWMLVFWPADAAIVALIPGMTRPFLAGLFPICPTNLPGVGLTLVELAGFAGALAVCGKKARIDRVTVPLLAACLAMSLFPSVYGNGVLRFLNAVVLWVVGTYTLFLVCRLSRRAAPRVGQLADALGLFFSSLFAHVLRPLRQLRELVRRVSRSGVADPAHEAKMATLRSAALGAAVAAGLLLIVMPLLISADSVFGSAVDGAWDTVIRAFQPREATSRIVCVLVAAPVLFGLLWGFTCWDFNGEDPAAPQAVAGKGHVVHAAALPGAIVVLAVLDAVYLVFVAVQFVYLFGGAESAAMFGGYAEYARSGFFQLVGVVAINIAVALPCERLAVASGKGAARAFSVALTCLLVASSFVMLASALMRMVFYVEAFGLTILRCLTFLGMAFSAVLLGALIAKLARPSLNFFAVFVYVGCVLWIAFNLVNVDARIADYNVDRYIGGQLEQIDESYLFALSPDARPAVERLLQEEALEGSLPSASGVPARSSDTALAEAWLNDADMASKACWQYQCLAYWVN